MIEQKMTIMQLFLLVVLVSLSFGRMNDSHINSEHVANVSQLPEAISEKQVQAFLSSHQSEECHSECLKKVNFM